jgi:hypothetical protein
MPPPLRVSSLTWFVALLPGLLAAVVVIVVGAVSGNGGMAGFGVWLAVVFAIALGLKAVAVVPRAVVPAAPPAQQPTRLPHVAEAAAAIERGEEQRRGGVTMGPTGVTIPIKPPLDRGVPTVLVVVSGVVGLLVGAFVREPLASMIAGAALALAGLAWRARHMRRHRRLLEWETFQADVSDDDRLVLTGDRLRWSCSVGRVPHGGWFPFVCKRVVERRIERRLRGQL